MKLPAIKRPNICLSLGIQDIKKLSKFFSEISFERNDTALNGRSDWIFYTLMNSLLSPVEIFYEERAPSAIINALRRVHRVGEEYDLFLFISSPEREIGSHVSKYFFLYLFKTVLFVPQFSRSRAFSKLVLSGGHRWISPEAHSIDPFCECMDIPEFKLMFLAGIKVLISLPLSLSSCSVFLFLLFLPKFGDISDCCGCIFATRWCCPVRLHSKGQQNSMKNIIFVAFYLKFTPQLWKIFW